MCFLEVRDGGRRECIAGGSFWGSLISSSLVVRSAETNLSEPCCPRHWARQRCGCRLRGGGAGAPSYQFGTEIAGFGAPIPNGQRVGAVRPQKEGRRREPAAFSS